MRRGILLAAAIAAFVGGSVTLARNQSPPARATTESPAFHAVKLDDGLSETAALADVDGDGRLDIVSSSAWYEAPAWTKRTFREIPVTNNYVDNFSDLPVDVNGDGHIDIVQIGYFARRLVWMENPGTPGAAWAEREIDAIGPTEFAFLVDLDGDGRATELLPQFTNRMLPLAWYELGGAGWVKHTASPRSYGHGIGAGDINGDGRPDIVTPEGWLEAPADIRASAEWTLHPASWLQPGIAVGPSPTGPSTAPAGRAAGARPLEFGFMHVIDLNEDGRNDVLSTMAHAFGVLWYEQRADGSWQAHLVDNSWSRAHASTLADVNGDGRLDLVTGTRFMGRNAAETEPLAMYWYEYEPGRDVSWTRHPISTGGDAGAGLQIAVADLDDDGHVEIVSGGKSGLFLFQPGGP